MDSDTSLSKLFLLTFLFFSITVVLGQSVIGHREIVIIAHRGGIVDGIPENTIAAFKNSIDLKVDHIEVDLRTSKDGEIVIFHDENLNRTTNGQGRLSDHSLAELKLLDAGHGQKIPTYSELLELCKYSETNLLLDIKDIVSDGYERVVTQTRKHDMIDRVIIGVRSLEDMSQFKALEPTLTFLGFIPNVDVVDEFIEQRISIIRLWPDWIRSDTGMVDRIHQKGAQVWTTAGDLPKDELLFLMETGINGILVDNPAALRKAIEGK